MPTFFPHKLPQEGNDNWKAYKEVGIIIVTCLSSEQILLILRESPANLATFLSHWEDKAPHLFSPAFSKLLPHIYCCNCIIGQWPDVFLLPAKWLGNHKQAASFSGGKITIHKHPTQDK